MTAVAVFGVKSMFENRKESFTRLGRPAAPDILPSFQQERFELFELKNMVFIVKILLRCNYVPVSSCCRISLSVISLNLHKGWTWSERTKMFFN